jgi:hypothetical protein
MKKSILAAKLCSILPAAAMVMLGMVLCSSEVYSQTLPVNQMDLDANLRNLQLMGKSDPLQSFNVRPLFSYATGRRTKDITGNDTVVFSKQLDPATRFLSYRNIHQSKNLTVAVLPFMFTTKFNSHHPYGWNDEGMIAAKGLQTELSAGIFAQAGPLTVQLQPQFVYAANPQYETSNSYGATVNHAYQKLLPGQSSIRLNLGAVSVGYSSENLWWGPGQFSSLLLSNNAPGFLHFTFNTTRPLKTAIGSFEFQLLGGTLDEDSVANMPYEQLHLKNTPLTDDWRYINGLVLSYQPSFLPNVFVGFSRSFQMYHTDFKLQPSFIEQYLPVFTALFKNATDNEDVKARDPGHQSFYKNDISQQPC